MSLPQRPDKKDTNTVSSLVLNNQDLATELFNFLNLKEQTHFGKTTKTLHGFFNFNAENGYGLDVLIQFAAAFKKTPKEFLEQIKKIIDQQGGYANFVYNLAYMGINDLLDSKEAILPKNPEIRLLEILSYYDPNPAFGKLFNFIVHSVCQNDDIPPSRIKRYDMVLRYLFNHPALTEKTLATSFSENVWRIPYSRYPDDYRSYALLCLDELLESKKINVGLLTPTFVSGLVYHFVNRPRAYKLLIEIIKRNNFIINGNLFLHFSFKDFGQELISILKLIDYANQNCSLEKTLIVEPGSQGIYIEDCSPNIMPIVKIYLRVIRLLDNIDESPKKDALVKIEETIQALTIENKEQAPAEPLEKRVQAIINLLKKDSCLDELFRDLYEVQTPTKVQTDLYARLTQELMQQKTLIPGSKDPSPRNRFFIVKKQPVTLVQVQNFLQKNLLDVNMPKRQAQLEKLIPEAESKELMPILQLTDEKQVTVSKEKICEVLNKLLSKWRTTAGKWMQIKMLESIPVLDLPQTLLHNNRSITIDMLDNIIHKKIHNLIKPDDSTIVTPVRTHG